MTILLATLSGLGTGLALIVAIGAQNAYLLRLAIGSRLGVVTVAVIVCAASDAALIVAGAAGVGAVLERFPAALVVVRFVGAAFLLAYGLLAVRRAVRGSGGAMRVDGADADLDATGAAEHGAVATAAARSGGVAAEPARSVVAMSTAEPAGRAGTVPPGRSRTAPTTRVAVLTMLAFTWANPHVYLDTLVFLGSLANQQGPELRWWWVGGAIVASCVWFAGVGFGGRALRPVFAKPAAWRVFDAGVAIVMLGFAVKLLLGA